jgi:hypothetical protein
VSGPFLPIPLRYRERWCRVSDPKSTSRSLRGFFATLTAICLIGAGVAYGVTRYRLMELEDHATRDARKVAVEVIQPGLTPHDASLPMSGERLASMRSRVEARVLTGPVNAVRIWSGDGVIVFADDPAQVGESQPAMRGEIHALTSGTTEDFVTGERFHSLVVLHVGKPRALMAVELVRSHTPLVERAGEPWYPWVLRALQVAALFAALWVMTWIGFLGYDVMKRGVRRRSRARKDTRKGEAPGRHPSPRPEDVPAYMRPGFREEVESRRAVEQELTSAKAERDELARRLEQAELQEAKASVTESA